MIFIFATFPNKKEAKEIGEKLVQKKLAACLVVFPVDSIYSWKKRVVRDREVAAILKTKKENFKKIEKFIQDRHSYDTPCIVEVPTGRIAKKYSAWLNKAV